MTLVFAIENGVCRIITDVTNVFSLFDSFYWKRWKGGEIVQYSADTEYLLRRYFAIYALMSWEEAAVWGVNEIKWFSYNHEPVLHLTQSEVNKLMMEPLEVSYV